MKFTLTTAFYNNSKDVTELYDAIKVQTYKNWEWIVTDDFSETDSAKDILLELSRNDRRVKYVEESSKKEMFWNPQRFCRNSDIIVQLDSDDRPLPKGLEVYHHFFTKFPDVGLIFCTAHLYLSNGNWKWYDDCDTRLWNNLMIGQMTFFRAWRNKPNANYDFNPNNWMKYFYNDYSIVCSLEENTKVLALPRNLYRYTTRDDSISHKPVDRPDLQQERNELFEQIKRRRLNPDMDTFNRYFEPMLDLRYCLMDQTLNNSDTQHKISFYSKNLNAQRENLFKELFFDHDLNFNKTDGDEEFLFYDVRSMEDFDNFIQLVHTHSKIRTAIVVINKSITDSSTGFYRTRYTSPFSEDEYNRMHNGLHSTGHGWYFVEQDAYRSYRLSR